MYVGTARDEGTITQKIILRCINKQMTNREVSLLIFAALVMF